MRKARQRAIRAAFQKANGRPPEGAPVYAEAYPGGPYRTTGAVSMWRRLKKAHLAGPPRATADAAITAAVKDARCRARKRAARIRRAGRAA